MVGDFLEDIQKRSCTMKPMHTYSLAGVLAFFTLLSPCQAEGLLGEEGIVLEAGSTIVGQQSSKQRRSIDKDLTASIDLTADADLGFGTLHIYVEGSTKPDVSASSIVAGANADAGTATNVVNQGRMQLSEISFGTDIGAVNINIGVIDLTGFADATDTANDEAAQFLANALVNNPSIAFPDYTPAIVLNYGAEDAPQLTAMLSNGYGLGDNATKNYADLFRFGKNAAGQKKGLFALGELRLPESMAGVKVTAGIWHKSSEFARFDGLGNNRNAFGGYLNLDGAIDEQIAWSARLGANNAKTEVTGGVTNFASLSAQYAINEQHILGVGVAYSGVSGAYKNTLLPDTGANSTVVEAYYNWQITEVIAISPDIQYHKNPNNVSAAAAPTIANSVWVYGLRVQINASHQMFSRESEI